MANRIITAEIEPIEEATFAKSSSFFNAILASFNPNPSNNKPVERQVENKVRIRFFFCLNIFLKLDFQENEILFQSQVILSNRIFLPGLGETSFNKSAGSSFQYK